ncbi:hypothetical protein MKX03_000962 [Papaver bracteatum]|nr:hypothetical protein MKX03_000962 [Papaver bracteatum]
MVLLVFHGDGWLDGINGSGLLEVVEEDDREVGVCCCVIQRIRDAGVVCIGVVGLKWLQQVVLRRWWSGFVAIIADMDGDVLLATSSCSRGCLWNMSSLSHSHNLNFCFFVVLFRVFFFVL